MQNSQRFARIEPSNMPHLQPVFLALGLWLLLAAAAHGAEPTPSCSLWLISTRAAPHCGQLDDATQSLDYWRMDDDGCWSPSDAAAFHASHHPAAPTVVFLHGNRTDADEAIAKGCDVLGSIQSAADGRPLRRVVWSWPAERMCRRNRTDVHLKIALGDAESYYLAQWLDRIEPGARVSLVGHSLGPRIIAGALHLLAGGQLAGRSLAPETVRAWTEGRRNPVGLEWLAAAIDADDLTPGGCSDRALGLGDRALATQNGCDRVLRWYPRLCGAQALGFVGPCGLDRNRDVLHMLDVSCMVGKIHDYRRYDAVISALGLWPRYTFLESD